MFRPGICRDTSMRLTLKKIEYILTQIPNALSLKRIKTMDTNGNLPDRKGGGALQPQSGKNELVRDISVKGTVITLPSTKPLDPKSPEYVDTFVKVLPPDAASEVVTVLNGEHSFESLGMDAYTEQ